MKLKANNSITRKQYQNLVNKFEMEGGTVSMHEVWKEAVSTRKMRGTKTVVGKCSTMGKSYFGGHDVVRRVDRLGKV